MSARRGVIAFTVVAALGLAGLLASAATPGRWTAFSADVPASGLIVYLTPGQTACQGPITVPLPFRALEAWVWPTPTAGPTLDLIVRDPHTHTVLATGSMPRGYSEPTPPTGYPSPLGLTATLDRNVSAHRTISLCLRARGPGAVTLMGGGQSGLSGTVEAAGHSTGRALALLFLRQHRESLLSLLSTVFRRAALFRPGWVGAWTFWALFCLLLACFPLAARAVARAGRSDAEEIGGTEGG